jgi:hypothetical protein
MVKHCDGCSDFLVAVVKWKTCEHYPGDKEPASWVHHKKYNVYRCYPELTDDRWEDE